MNELIQQIRTLPNDRVMEAARLLAGADVPPAKPETILQHIVAETQDLQAEDLAAALQRATPDQIAELSRALLTYAALSGREEEVREALQGAGESMLVLEIIAVGALLLSAYQLWQTKGVSKSTVTTEISIKPDGTITIRQEEVTENFSVGEILGQAIKAAMPAKT